VATRVVTFHFRISGDESCIGNQRPAGTLAGPEVQVRVDEREGVARQPNAAMLASVGVTARIVQG